MSEWVTIVGAETAGGITTNGEASVAAVVTEKPAPELMSTGTYAIYRTTLGGWHVAYQPSDVDKLQHFEIPPIAVQMFQRIQSGDGLPNPMEMFKQLMAARNGS